MDVHIWKLWRIQAYSHRHIYTFRAVKHSQCSFSWHFTSILPILRSCAESQARFSKSVFFTCCCSFPVSCPKQHSPFIASYHVSKHIFQFSCFYPCLKSFVASVKSLLPLLIHLVLFGFLWSPLHFSSLLKLWDKNEPWESANSSGWKGRSPEISHFPFSAVWWRSWCSVLPSRTLKLSEFRFICPFLPSVQCFLVFYFCSATHWSRVIYTEEG